MLADSGEPSPDGHMGTTRYKDRLLWVLTGTLEPARRAAPPVLSTLSISWSRRTLAPFLLLSLTPLLVVILWMVCAWFDGSMLRFVREIDSARFVALFPRPTLKAAAILAGWVLSQYLLLRLLPGKPFDGPITPQGNQPRYRLNGLAAWVVTHTSLLLAFFAGLWSPASLYRQFGSLFVTLNLAALLFCVFLYWKGRNHPSSSDAVYSGHFFFDFFQGTELHPTLFGTSLKQLINCRVSMMGWSVLVLCCLGYQYETTGTVSSSMLVSAGLLVLYLFKFFWWESGYLTSLDIMHDRFGYYICWGVLVWVPVVYTISAQYLANHPRSLAPWCAIAISTVGLVSLWMNYAADAQRQRVRARNGNTTVWGKPARLLRASYVTADGQERQSLLLASGYWGIARHFHYVPELALALCWALPAGFASLTPYIYFIFLTILLFDRARRDDLRCARKYGDTWLEYRRQVPYRIIPGIY
jgi:7-dehydrocholesterol reductase